MLAEASLRSLSPTRSDRATGVSAALPSRQRPDPKVLLELFVGDMCRDESKIDAIKQNHPAALEHYVQGSIELLCQFVSPRRDAASQSLEAKSGFPKWKLEQVSSNEAKPVLKLTIGEESIEIASPSMTIDAWAFRLYVDFAERCPSYLEHCDKDQWADVKEKFNKKRSFDFVGTDFSQSPKTHVEYLVRRIGNRQVDCRIKHANISTRDLRQLHLKKGSVTSNVNFSGSDMRNAFMQELTIVDSNMCEVKLKHADLNRARIIETNLTNADMSEVDMRNTNFLNSTMRGAVLTKVNIVGTNFTGVIFNGNEQFVINFRETWEQWTLDLFFNHLINTDSGSVLTAIESIDDKYKELKLKLTYQVIEVLQKVDVARIGSALLDIWMNNPIYREDAKVQAFIREKILVSKIKEANTSALHVSSTQELRLLLAIAIEADDTFMLDNNFFFVQLLALCIDPLYNSIEEQLESLLLVCARSSNKAVQDKVSILSDLLMASSKTNIKKYTHQLLQLCSKNDANIKHQVALIGKLRKGKVEAALDMKAKEFQNACAEKRNPALSLQAGFLVNLCTKPLEEFRNEQAIQLAYLCSQHADPRIRAKATLIKDLCCAPEEQHIKIQAQQLRYLCDPVEHAQIIEQASKLEQFNDEEDAEPIIVTLQKLCNDTVNDDIREQVTLLGDLCSANSSVFIKEQCQALQELCVSAHDADIKSQAERVQDLSTPSLSYNTKKQLDRFANVCTDPADAHLIKQAKLLIHLCTEAPATNMQGQLKILQLLCERHRDIRMHALASVFEDIRAQSRSDGHARRDIIHKFAVQLHMVCTTEHNLADIQQEAQQLLTLCVESNQVERLYKNYMDLKELKVAKQAAESGIRGSGDDQTNFAFVSDDYTLLLSRKNIHDMLHMHPGHDWDQVCLYKGDELDTEMGLKEVYERFSLFNNAYQYMLNAATFAKLLKTMNLNFTAKHVEAYELEQKEYQENVQEPENEKDQDNSGVIILKPRDYAPLFMSAIAQGKSTVKLVELADQEALWRLFQPLLSKERGEGQTATVISPDHADQILDIYEITDASARDQAMHFFCLAYLFAYYSSAHVFGIERNSPYALRLYAAGLLYKARELDPTIFIDQSGDDKFDYYIKELTKPSFGCTAVLSNNHMRPLIISNGGNAILIKIKPPGFA